MVRGSSAALSASTLAMLLLTACSDSAPAPKPPTPAVRAPAPPTGAGAPAGTASGSASAPASGAQAQAPHGAAPTVPPSLAPAATSKLSTSESDPARVEIGGLELPKPVTWTWQKPTMQFRTLQYAVPASGGATPSAELIFSLFPPGDGGAVANNLDRWAKQFRADDGGELPAPEAKTREIDGVRVTRVDHRGAYMGMGAAAPRPGTTQLAAIIEAPGSTIFVRLLGSEGTVEGARAAFEGMIDGLKRASGAAKPTDPPAEGKPAAPPAGAKPTAPPAEAKPTYPPAEAKPTDPPAPAGPSKP